MKFVKKRFVFSLDRIRPRVLLALVLFIACANVVNLAVARRSVATTVDEDEIGTDPGCGVCAPAGEFSLELYGAYVDYSIEFGN